MFTLQQNDYRKVAPLFQAYCHHEPIFGSVLEGVTPGVLLVDDENKPKTAFMFIPGVWAYFAGDCTNHCFIKEATDYIFNLVPSEIGEVVIFSPTDSWRDTLDEILAERRVIRIVRKTFRFDNKIDSILRQDPASILDDLVMRNTTAENGNFGVGLFRGDNMVSECRSVFVGFGQAEISVHTCESERQKGLARLVSTAFIEECRKRSLTPCWGCWPYNEASERLAKSLGFVPTEDLPAHFWQPGM